VKSTPPVNKPTIGIITSSTRVYNFPECTTNIAVAKLNTSPFIKEALKSLKNPKFYLNYLELSKIANSKRNTGSKYYFIDKTPLHVEIYW
jgi:hypothetical protein